MERRGRQRAGIVAHVALGVVGGAALAGLAPWLTGLLFGRGAKTDSATAGWYGLAFICISWATPLIRNILIPRGKSGIVFRSSILSVVVGLSVMALGIKTGHIWMIAMGMALSELVSFLVCGPAAWRLLHAR